MNHSKRIRSLTRRHGATAVCALVVMFLGYASAASAATLYGLIDTGELFSSADNGVSWAPLSTLPVRDAVALGARLSASDLFMVSRSGSVYRSLNGGSSWAAVGAIAASDVADMAFRADGALLVLTASGSVYRSTDLGVTFTGVSTLTASNCVSLGSATGAPARYYALTRTGEVYESTDGGDTWTASGTMAVSDAARIRSVVSTLYVLTGTGDVYRSTDAAASWTAVGTLSQLGMQGLVRNGSSLAAASREGHVATSADGVSWSWQGSMNQLTLTALASDEPVQTAVGSQPATFLVSAAFPSPSRGLASVEVRLGAGASVRLALYDVRGRLVAKRGPEYLDGGQHLITWTPGVERAGVYFMRVEAEGGPATTTRWLVVD